MTLLQAMYLFFSSILLLLLFSLAAVPFTFAKTETHIEVSNNGEGANSEVNVENSTGESTVCVNGKCTTSSGNSENNSTVCINGECTTSNGDVNIHSEDENAKVTINNNTTSETTVTNELKEKNIIDKEKKWSDKKASIEAKRKEVRQKKKEKEETFLERLKQFFTFQFFFKKDKETPGSE